MGRSRSPETSVDRRRESSRERARAKDRDLDKKRRDRSPVSRHARDDSRDPKRRRTRSRERSRDRKGDRGRSRSKSRDASVRRRPESNDRNRDKDRGTPKDKERERDRDRERDRRGDRRADDRDDRHGDRREGSRDRDRDSHRSRENGRVADSDRAARDPKESETMGKESRAANGDAEQPNDASARENGLKKPEVSTSNILVTPVFPVLSRCNTSLKWVCLVQPLSLEELLKKKQQEQELQAKVSNHKNVVRFCLLQNFSSHAESAC